MPTPDLEALIAEEAEIIADKMNRAAQWAESEEDVRYECNKLLDDFIKKADLRIKGRHEYGLAGGHVDSKYAGVIIDTSTLKAQERSPKTLTHSQSRGVER